MISISVIIPVYNRVEELRKSLNSVVNQKYERTEIIVVDDGSTSDIREALAEPYISQKGVKLIRQQNAGPGIARNTGLKLAQGEVVIFLDSDDELRDNALIRVATEFESSNADLVAYDFVVRDVNGTTNSSSRLLDGDYPAGEKLSGKESIDILYSGRLGNFSCMYAYRLSYLRKQGVLFPAGRVLEDAIFINELLAKKPEVSCLSGPAVYTYCMNEESLTHKRSNEAAREAINKIRAIEEMHLGEGSGYLVNLLLFAASLIDYRDSTSEAIYRQSKHELMRILRMRGVKYLSIRNAIKSLAVIVGIYRIAKSRF